MSSPLWNHHHSPPGPPPYYHSLHHQSPQYSDVIRSFCDISFWWHHFFPAARQVSDTPSRLWRQPHPSQFRIIVCSQIRQLMTLSGVWWQIMAHIWLQLLFDCGSNLHHNARRAKTVLLFRKNMESPPAPQQQRGFKLKLSTHVLAKFWISH